MKYLLVAQLIIAADRSSTGTSLEQGSGVECEADLAVPFSSAVLCVYGLKWRSV